MSEQFGFWVACVVMIAVVAGGCEMHVDLEKPKSNVRLYRCASSQTPDAVCVEIEAAK